MSISIEVDRLSFAYDSSRPVLRHLTFSVAPGKTLAVLGVSGSGKSTLIRLLCGLLSDRRRYEYSGSVRVGGNTSTLSLRADGRIGPMFQEPTLLPHLTVEKNVSLPIDMGIGRGSQGDVVQLIDFVGLSAWRDSLPARLSTGMRTRAALARTFVTHPDLLLLDEPFSALDVGWRMTLYESLTRLREAGSPTTVLVTHDIEEAVLLADAILILSHRGESGEVFQVDGARLRDFSPQAVTNWLSTHAALLLSLRQIIHADHVLREASPKTAPSTPMAGV